MSGNISAPTGELFTPEEYKRLTVLLSKIDYLQAEVMNGVQNKVGQFDVCQSELANLMARNVASVDVSATQQSVPTLAPAHLPPQGK